MNPSHYEIRRSVELNGFCVIDRFIAPNEASACARDVMSFLGDSRNSGATQLQYNNSEKRLHNSQYFLPSVVSIHNKLRSLNLALFGDRMPFATLAISNSPCTEHDIHNRWHIDSWRKQYKFFLQLTSINSPADGPFQFVPFSHGLRNRVRIAALNGFSGLPYFDFSSYKRAYVSIADPFVELAASKLSTTINAFLGQEGDLLVADVRMIHRDSPCITGSRVALHSYLGIDPARLPNGNACIPPIGETQA